MSQMRDMGQTGFPLGFGKQIPSLRYGMTSMKLVNGLHQGSRSEGGEKSCLRDAHSTGLRARYPSRAVMVYFSFLFFSSTMVRGRPSLSTSSTLILRKVPSCAALVGR